MNNLFNTWNRVADKPGDGSLVNPEKFRSTGRNFNEILRVLDSMQLTAAHRVATPVNWKNGEDVIIVPAVSDAEAKEKYPEGWKTIKPYLRVVAQPGK